MRGEEYERYSQLLPRKSDSLVLSSDECRLCSDAELKFVGTNIIWGNGPCPAKIMIIGKDSAGESREEPLWKGSRLTGVPLTNKKSGAKLRILLKKAGIDPFLVFITNTVKCNVGYDDRKLTYSALAPICITHLRAEISIVRPRVIIALGVDAARRVAQLWRNPALFCFPDRDCTETLADHGRLPFRGMLSEVTGDTRADAVVHVFGAKHPSYVEGQREKIYIKNLETMSNVAG